MYPTIPRGSPPPAYSPPPPGAGDNPSPSPTLTELEIEAFGRPIAYGPRPPRPSASSTPHSVIGVVDSSDVSARVSQAPAGPHLPASEATPVLDPAPVLRAQKRKANGASAAAQSTVTATAPSEFEILINVLQPDKRMRQGGKMKTTKVDPIKFGPLVLSLDLDWEAFKEVIADAVTALPAQLAISSLEWHFSKPQNSPWVLLTNDQGWTSFVKQISAKVAKDPSVFAILRMQPPMIVRQAALPWAPAPNSSAAGAQDDDEVSEGDMPGQSNKKMRLDDEVEDVASRLEEKYPVGLCEVHPDKQCFFHRVSKLHFDIGDRTRRLVWAAAIRKGDASFDKIPLGSNFFKPEHALKVMKPKPGGEVSRPPGDVVPVQAATPAPPTMSAGPQNPPTPLRDSQSHYPPYPPPPPPSYNPYFPYPMPPTPYYPHYPAQPTPWPPYVSAPFVGSSHQHGSTLTPTRGRYNRDLESMRSSSPPLPDCDLHEFCEAYDLDATIEDGLKELGFRIGDDLSDITSAEWERVGIKLLARKRVLKAYNKYKTDSRK